MVISLPPDYRKVIPTDEHEYNEILRAYKQDRRTRDVLNDFTDYDIRPYIPEA